MHVFNSTQYKTTKIFKNASKLNLNRPNNVQGKTREFEERKKDFSYFWNEKSILKHFEDKKIRISRKDIKN